MSGDDRMADPDAVEMQATMQQQPPHEPQDLNASLHKHFGHDRFRPGQEAVVRSVLSGQPTLAILPTGGGKSLCYQLPALLLPGTTVVASPLVALMKDQVDALIARGIPATFINSSIGENERQERQARLRRGELKIVYVAPERFRSSWFLNSIAQIQVPLLAVDEAHCISSWGHDFRPDYAQLQRSRETIRAGRILALTATATAEVRADIAQALGLENPRVFVAGFDRPNLFLESTRVTGDADKLARLTALARAGTPGLVYAATRRNVEKVVVALRARGIKAIGYHAGMDDAARTRSQDKFVRNECEVIVATNAFGMGVDKPDIRFVAHFDVPRTVEAWYQEIGRAGRDGKDSLALLLFNFADVKLQQRLIDGGRASESVVRAALAGARRLGSGSLDALARATGLSTGAATRAARARERRPPRARTRLGRRRRVRGGAEQRSDGAGSGDRLRDAREAGDARAADARPDGAPGRFTRLPPARAAPLLRRSGSARALLRLRQLRRASRARAQRGRGARLRTRSLAPRREPRWFAGHRPGSRCRRRERRAGRIPPSSRPSARCAPSSPAPPPRLPMWSSTTAPCARSAAQRPASREAFLRVKGAGPARWDRYGERVLEVIRKAGPAEQRGRACAPADALRLSPRSRPPGPARWRSPNARPRSPALRARRPRTRRVHHSQTAPRSATPMSIPSCGWSIIPVLRAPASRSPTGSAPGRGLISNQTRARPRRPSRPAARVFLALARSGRSAHGDRDRAGGPGRRSGFRACLARRARQRTRHPRLLGPER